MGRKRGDGARKPTRHPLSACRQNLVGRLNTYCRKHKPLFEEVVDTIHSSVMPQIRRCGQAGYTEFRTSARPFKDSPLACEMLIDVLTDRGFSCSHIIEEGMLPSRFDRVTGEITCVPHTTHRFRSGVGGLCACQTGRPTPNAPVSCNWPAHRPAGSRSGP